MTYDYCIVGSGIGGGCLIKSLLEKNPKLKIVLNLIIVQYYFFYLKLNLKINLNDMNVKNDLLK